MARREIDTIWDRETRNNINENFIELYNEYIGAGLDAKEAKQKAEQALNIAKRAEDKADNVQEQFNQVVIEGDSSVEAAQARVDADGYAYSTLKERLDSKETKFSSRLAQKEPILKNGKVFIPTDFTTLPFNIYRRGLFDYTHDATPYSFLDWSDAEEVFISKSGSTNNSGLDWTIPITMSRFTENLNNNVYSSDKIILTILDYHHDNSDSFTFDSVNKHFYIRSGNVTGNTFIGRTVQEGKGLLDWSVYEGVYQTQQDGTNYTLIDAFIASDLSSKYPKRYDKVSSFSECQSNKGTFYTSGAFVYLNPHDGHDISKIKLSVDSSPKLRLLGNSGKVNIIENLTFLSSSYRFNFENIDTIFALFGCRFWRGKNDGFSVNGAYKAYLFDCISAYASKDGFNYHNTNTETTVVEVNCQAYGAGQYKMLDGQQTTNSNNGSTAHNGMKVLRIGGKYWDCEGPIVADANDCYSINIGCVAVNVLPTTTGRNACFQLYATSGQEEVNPKYIIECGGYGAEFGIHATPMTKIMNWFGEPNMNHEFEQIDWNEVL